MSFLLAENMQGMQLSASSCGFRQELRWILSRNRMNSWSDCDVKPETCITCLVGSVFILHIYTVSPECPFRYCAIVCHCFLKKSSAPSHFSSWSRMMPAKATLTPGICLSIKNSRLVLALMTLLRRESLRLQHHHSHSTRSRNLGNRLNQRDCCLWCQNLQWFEMIWTLKTCFLMVCLSISNNNDMKLERAKHAMSSKPLESAVQYLYCRTWYETRTYKLQEKLGVIWRCILLKPTGKAIPKKKNPTDLSFHARG